MPALALGIVVAVVALSAAAHRPASPSAGHHVAARLAALSVPADRLSSSDPPGSCPASGATDTWTGGAGTTNWADAGNWSSGAPPGSTDFACLPAGTPGAQPISVPASSLGRLLSFKPLTLASGITTAQGADFEADVQVQGGSLAGPSVVIGAAATATVTGAVSLPGPVAVSNAGTIDMADGGSLSEPGACSSNNPSLLNTGTIDFTDSKGTYISLYCGKLVNQAGGTITKTGTAGYDSVSGNGQIENDGTVISAAGVLAFSGGSSTSPGTFTTTGAGHVDLGMGPSRVTTSSQTTFGNGVYVTGILAGAATIPAGVTLTVGTDPAAPSADIHAGTLDAPVTGAGTLATAGTNISGTGTFEATVAADLNAAAATLGPYSQFTAKADGTPTSIGAGTTVTVTGGVSLAGSVTVANAGVVDLANGGSLSVPGSCSSNNPSLLNTGTIDFTDSKGTSIYLYCGKVVNQAGGTITKTGTAAYDSVGGGGQVENDGTVSAQAGVLGFSGLGPSTSPGTFTGGGSGHVDLGPNRVAVTPDTIFGNGVWVTGTVAGTVSVPAGVTVNVGADPIAPDSAAVGTLNATVIGNGTLNVSGTLFDNQYPEVATVAGDLAVASTTMGPYSEFGVKPDGTATQILSTVTMTATPALAPGLTLYNEGTLDFGANDYFTCSTCTVNNFAGSTMQVNNPDGSFDHSFNIDAGTFTNDGLIKLTGYLPGSSIEFGSGATVKKKGQAEFDGLQQPSWVGTLQSSGFAHQVATALGQAGLASLARNAAMALAANIGYVGVANCANANARLGPAGASIGACVEVGSDGSEGIALTVSSGGAVPFPGEGEWSLNDVFTGLEGTVDAGAQIMWEVDDTGAQVSPFSVTNNLDGPAWCENGGLSVGVGLVGQHCWGPEDKVPFDLGSLPLTLAGVHSLYLGASTGGGISGGVVLSYSIAIGCAQWYSDTQTACPPANVAPPVISGTPAVGQALSTDNGSWDPAGGITGYSYQWQSCQSSALSSCEPISGATSSQYTIKQGDENNYISVIVTAKDGSGSNPSPLATPVFVP